MWRYARHSLYRCKTNGEINIRCTARAFLERRADRRPVPQPNLVPVRFSPSRITHNNGVAGGASVDAALPFTVKMVVILSSLQIDEDARWAG